MAAKIATKLLNFERENRRRINVQELFKEANIKILLT